IINMSVTDRVQGVGILQYLFSDSRFGVINIEPDQVASMSHQRGDGPVAQMKYPLYDLLLCLLDGALLGSFADDCLNLFFRYLVACCFDVEQFNEQEGRF